MILQRISEKMKERKSIEEIKRMEESKRIQTRKTIQGIFEAFYTDRFSRTFHKETTICDDEGSPDYEIDTIVSIRKLKKQKDIPKRIEINMTIDNNAMSTNINIIKETEMDRKKPRIMSEITIRPADKEKRKVTPTKESNDEEIMFLSEHEIQDEEKQNLSNQINMVRKNSSRSNREFENLFLINSQGDEKASQKDDSTLPTQPMPSTSSVNTKALRQYPGSMRSPLGGIMKPEASTSQTSSGADRVLEESREVTKYRPVRTEVVKDEKGREKTIIIFCKVSDDEQSDESLYLATRMRRKRKRVFSD